MNVWRTVVLVGVCVVIPLAVACRDPMTPAPSTLVAITAINQEVGIGTVLRMEPGVEVRDQSGRPLGGVTVTFTLAEGVGPITPTTVVTGAEGSANWGRAFLDEWHITQFGRHAVTASVSGLAPVEFTVSGDGPFISGLSEQPRRVLPDSPGIILFQVRRGPTPMPGVPVTLTAMAGGGSVSPGSTVTDFIGAVRATWIVGAAPGVNAVSVAVAGFEPVILTAHAGRVDSCEPGATVGLPGSVSGLLAPDDCKLLGGEPVDDYRLHVEAETIVRLRVAANIAIHVAVETENRRPIAWGGGSPSDTPEATVVLIPGSYRVAVSSHTPTATGLYTLTTEVLATGAPRPCGVWSVVPGITLDGQLGGCVVVSGVSTFPDRFAGYIARGETVQITVAAEDSNPHLRLSAFDTSITRSPTGTSEARVTYTAPFSQFYSFQVGEFQPWPYTLRVENLQPAP